MIYKQTALDTLKTHNYKITPQRTTVIDILAKSKKPLNPYDIAKISNDTVNVATVYRTMELFEQLGLVHKIRSVDGYIACSTNHHSNSPVIAREQSDRGNPGNNHNHSHCHHYAVCTNCHKVQELEILPTEGGHTHNHNLPNNFHSDKQVYELTGKCEKCV